MLPDHFLRNAGEPDAFSVGVGEEGLVAINVGCLLVSLSDEGLRS